jgi:glycosyltransferase involved in cell wall biosynthesis
MKIAILCRNLRVAGGLVVGLNVLRCLSIAGSSNRYLVVAPPGVGYEDIDLPTGSEMVFYRGGSNAWHQWRFDSYDLLPIMARFGPDVIFAMGNVGLVSPPCPQAILFHKPHLLYTSRHHPGEVWQARIKNLLLKLRLKRCLKNTHLVFCQTPVARERFHRRFSYPLELIKIMPNAVSASVKIPRDEAAMPALLKEKTHFTLFTLTKYYAHKNLEVLIHLFRNHPKILDRVRCIVTVAEDQHPNASRFLNDIRIHGLQEHIVNAGPLSAGQLAGYFYNSDALFFPTLLESFSGTYLEAMHFGLPILTSDLDFARYVCGDAALYFDAWKASDMVDKILMLRENEKLRAELIERGRGRIQGFFRSWEEITAETISELELLSMKNQSAKKGL